MLQSQKFSTCSKPVVDAEKCIENTRSYLLWLCNIHVLSLISISFQTCLFFSHMGKRMLKVLCGSCIPCHQIMFTVRFSSQVLVECRLLQVESNMRYTLRYTVGTKTNGKGLSIYVNLIVVPHSFTWPTLFLFGVLVLSVCNWFVPISLGLLIALFSLLSRVYSSRCLPRVY